MRHAIRLTGTLLLLAVLPAGAQIGKNVPIRAGTPEDRALAEIGAATDPAEKLALIDKFAAELGTGDLAIVADEQYVNYYLTAKNYDKAFEYGEKLWTLDPDNFANGINLVRGAQEKGDAERLFTYGEKIGAILHRFKAQPAPAGREANDWEQVKARTVEDNKENIAYIEQSLFAAAYGTTSPAARAGLLERFAKAFPDSSYADQGRGIAAASFQLAQNYPKMLAVANSLLAKDTNNLGMLILLADYYSEKGEQLDKAESYAKNALEVLPAAKKPEGATDEQWQQQISLQKGLVLSALGQININRNNNAQALENLKAAGPLLKPDAVTYGRNQYRLGFALLNLKRVSEARAALTEAAAINSPYKGLAQQKLQTLPAAPAPPARKKKS